MEKPSVLYLCTQNACRSQMAEAWTRHIYGEAVRVVSAGVRPAPQIDPLGVTVMAERGVSMEGQRPKVVKDVQESGPFDLLVTVCSRAADECPNYSGARQRVHAPFEDPPQLATTLSSPTDAYRKVRDEIETFVRDQLPDLLLGLRGVTDRAKAPSLDKPLPTAEQTNGDHLTEMAMEKINGIQPVGFTHDKSAAKDSQVLVPVDLPQEASSPPQPGVWKGLSILDRLLPVLIITAMVVGVVLGYYTNIGDALNVATIASVNAPVAVGLWLMMWPVLCKVRYELLRELFQGRELWTQIGVSLVLNWVVGPLLMTALAWATLPDLLHYRNGVVLVGLARCIAMVLIWNQLARGNPEYCAILVAVNSIFQIILYAPFTLLFVGVFSSQNSSSFQVSFWDVARSVLIFLGAPLLAGILTRYALIAIKGKAWLEQRFLPVIGPLALVALVYTVLVLFGLQGRHVIEDIGNVVRVAVPMLLYFSITWISVLLIVHRLGSTYELAVTQAFTASSNNFELAIAIAVATFGVQSPEALAATIGPLIEVPALLLLVYLALWLRKRWLWPKETA